MGPVSLNLFKDCSMISSSPRLNISRVSNERLLRKNSTTNNMIFCVDHISKNFFSSLHSRANNRNSGILGNDSVSLAKGQLSSRMDDGLGIIEFFCGKKLLITGATGFLAKVLVEKILRTMPEVDKIYLLIKANDKEAAKKRLVNEIINTELFECLREEHGALYETFILSKLVPVVGNMPETNLGIEEDVAKRIAREVDVIINSAATTTFDERFDVALDINTRGAARIVNFAKKCEKLKVYVHVSTAYASRQSEGTIIEESYKHVHGLDIEAEINLASEMKESLKQHEINRKLKDLGMNRAQKNGWPNTYAFTKAMGEMVVEDTKGQLPVIIIRPSIVESTLKEPFPGWIEGNRMIDPVILLYGKGLLPGFWLNPKIALDVVPSDIVVNLTLAAIAKHGGEGSKLEDSSDNHVYQIASSIANPLIAQDLLHLVYQHFSLNPFYAREGNPIQISAFKFFTSIEDLLSDMKSTNGNEKISPRQELIRRKSIEHIKYLANLYQPYSFFDGRYLSDSVPYKLPIQTLYIFKFIAYSTVGFNNNKVEKLLECLSEEEIKDFGFDVSSIDWKDYITSVHLYGLRKHVMKERGLK